MSLRLVTTPVLMYSFARASVMVAGESSTDTPANRERCDRAGEDAPAGQASTPGNHLDGCYDVAR
jgi:hypothetical protein